MMKSNIIIKVVAVTAILIVIMIVMKSGKESRATVNADLSAIESGPAKTDNGLSQNRFDAETLEKEHGVDVDSPLETMRTLTNEMLVMREASQKLQDENKELKMEINKLLKMESSINNRVNTNLRKAERSVERKQKELESDQNASKTMLVKLQDKLAQYTSDDKSGNKRRKGKSSAGGYSIGEASVPDGLGYDENGLPIDYNEVEWINPVDVKVNDKKGTMSLPKLFDRASEAVPLVPGKDKKKKKAPLIKAYTIPQNATLIGSVSMTALLGRIPVGGSIQDPYPFKILVGEENLSSNGINIPNVTGVKMTGVASGDWTLSCVSGKIYSMTFTFRDGTIRTVPEPGKKVSEPIAWMSDANGIPCVTGQRITNAISYLSSRVGLSAASGYASAAAAAELTNSINGNGNSQSTLTGDPSTYAKNIAIGDGLDEVTDWLDERQASSFDAIYVPPGTSLVIHTVDELRIDYDPEGRKVNHYATKNRRTEHYID